MATNLGASPGTSCSCFLLRLGLSSLERYFEHKMRDILVADILGLGARDSFLKWPGAPHSKQRLALVFSPWDLGLFFVRPAPTVPGQVA
ncbi:hypothetical protein Tco_1216158 [Tanacetum coccineum]